MEEDIPHSSSTERSWYESKEAQVWARENLGGATPPAFHSPERAELIKSLENHELKLKKLRLFMTWRDSPSLQDEIWATKAAIGQIEATIAVWRFLIPEVLMIIFQNVPHPVFSAADERDGDIYLCKGHVVSQVCRYWRMVALAQPSCWSTMSYFTSLKWSELMALWDERSVTAGIDIISTLSGHRRRSQSYHHHPIQIKHGPPTAGVTRWRTLTFVDYAEDRHANRQLNVYQFPLVNTGLAANLVELDLRIFQVNIPGSYMTTLHFVVPPFPALQRVKHRAAYAYFGNKDGVTTCAQNYLPTFNEIELWLSRDSPFLRVIPLTLTGPDGPFGLQGVQWQNLPPPNHQGAFLGGIPVGLMNIHQPPNPQNHLPANGLSGWGTSVRVQGTDDFLLESLDCSEHVELSSVNNNWKLKPTEQTFLTRFVLPPESDIEYINWLLENLAHHAPNLESLTFTLPSFFVSIIMPHFLSLTSITIQHPILSGYTRDQFQAWLEAVPNLHFLTLGEVTWIEVGAARTLVSQLYEAPESEPFSWFKLENAKLYAWSHPWFLCILKRDASLKKLHAEQHPFWEGDPLTTVNGYEFPYAISLSWRELENHVEAVRAEVDEVWGCA